MSTCILLAIFSIAVAEQFIQRRIDHKQWTTLPDRFHLPDSQCRNDYLYCNSMGAHLVDYCKCECNDLSKTFGFFDGKWKCAEKEYLQANTNCPMDVTFYRENGSNIFTIPLQPLVTIEYKAPFLVNKSCSLEGTIEYMHCNGVWTAIAMRRSFSLSEHQAITPVSTEFDSNLLGTVIKLNIGCDDGSSRKPICVLFKVEGNQSCTIELPSILTTTSSASSKSIQTRPFAPSTIQTTEGRTFLSTDVSEPTTPLKQTRAPIAKHTRRPTSSDNSGLIAGATGGAVALIVIALAILIIIVLRRRKRQKVSTNTADNRGYVNGTNIQLSSNDQEYDYAYSQPSVAKPHPQNTGSKSSVTNRVYGLTEDLNSQASNNNTPDGPVYAKPDKTKKTKDSSEQDNSVFYHTLEGPEDGRSNNEPVYNELEAPVSHDPAQYRALEENVPHVYCALIRPTSDQVGSTSNLQDYDSVGSII